MRIAPLLLAAALSCLYDNSAVASAQAPSDWAQFLGPNRTGKVDGPKGPFQWGEKGPDVLWRAPTGPGFGGAAVQGNEVFLFDHELGTRDILRVLDLETGTEKWSAEYPIEGRQSFPGSRTVPTVTPDKVYTCGPFGHVACFDRTSKELVWIEHLRETYGGEEPMFGWSCSPLIVGDIVVFSALGPEVGLVALKKDSGEEAWVTEPVGYSHSTPVLLELLGEPQIVFLSTMAQGSGQDEAAEMTISSFDPDDGSMIWRTTTLCTRLPIPGPVRIDDERFFVTGGYRGGSTMLKVSKKDGKYAFETLFHIDRGAQIHTPLLQDDHLFLIVNENWNDNRARHAEGGLLCLSLDGKELWRTGETPNFGRGNALLVGDRLLIQDGYDGVLRVAKAGPEKYAQEAEAKLFGDGGGRDGQMWAPMALAGGRLLMRSQEELLCVKL